MESTYFYVLYMYFIFGDIILMIHWTELIYSRTMQPSDTVTATLNTTPCHGYNQHQLIISALAISHGTVE